MARMILNETSYFGAGCREELDGVLKSKGFKKCLVMTDSDLVKFGVAKFVTDILDKNGYSYSVYTDIKPNPTVKNVLSALKEFDSAKPDCIIAIGGGSVIDCAKAVGIIVNNRDFSDVVSLEGVADTKNKSFPLIAFATTAGTAAEVTINYVITDEQSKRKLVCVDANDIPRVAFNDAEMMKSKPKGLTAATGMDALTHAIEGYVTPGANTISETLCLKSIELIAKNLKNAVDNGQDTVARENMALGSYMAGMAFSNVGLGIVHSMAHPLGARFDIAHGVANALLLPYVLEYNKSACIKKYGDIAKAMGVDTTNLSDIESANACIDAVKTLSESINIPKTLTEIGIKKADLKQLSKDAFVDPCTGGNPKSTSENDILQIYNTAL